MHLYNNTPDEMAKALEHARGISQAVPAYVFIDGDGYVGVADVLPYQIMTRGGFFVFTDGTGTWVPSMAKKNTED
jgi:hypothetical protein